MRILLLRWFTVCTIGLGTAGACLPSASPQMAPPPAPSPTTVFLYADGAQEVVHSSPLQTVPTQQIAEPPLVTAQPCIQTADAIESVLGYDIVADLDFPAKTVQVSQSINYRNNTGMALQELVFYVAPNKQPGVFMLNGISFPGQELAPVATLEGVRLSVPLAGSLLPDCSIALSLSYEIAVPVMGSGYFPRQGYMGYGSKQLNLGNWIPTLAYFRNGEWITPAPVNIGEQTVTPAANYTLSLTIHGAPDDLMVVGPGHMTDDNGIWHVTLPCARDLVLSFSTQYHRLSASGVNGTQVEVYTLDDAQPLSSTNYNSSRQALETAVSALELFSDLYSPYPYERLVIVESEFPDGMEFSGLVFVGGEWFRSYTGNPASYLTLITAHEVAHQWWYALVANDQSREPWLDEALSIYSEYIYLQENYPELADWWWSFRVDSYLPQGYVDSTVYEFDTIRGYINAVYLQGARLMHALRQNLGGEVFFQWLGNYAETLRGQIATAEDFWNALPPQLLPQIAATRAAYLRHFTAN